MPCTCETWTSPFIFTETCWGCECTIRRRKTAAAYRRRAAYLDWEGNDDSFKLVIAQYLDKEYQNGGTDATPIDHFSFWVDDIHEMYEKLTTDGVQCFSEPREVDNTLFQPVYGCRYYSLFCYDPDGLPIQFEQCINE